MKLKIQEYVSLQKELMNLQGLRTKGEIDEEEHKNKSIEINKKIETSENFYETDNFDEFRKEFLSKAIYLNKKAGFSISKDYIKGVNDLAQHEKEHSEVNEKYGFKTHFCLILDETAGKVGGIQPSCYVKNLPELIKDWKPYKKMKYQIEVTSNPKKLSVGDTFRLKNLGKVLEYDKSLTLKEKEELVKIVNERLLKN